MRVSVDHRTRYRFTSPQDRLIQLLRLTPQDSADQTVVNWHIGVDCDARLREARDGFGNRVTMLYAEGPIEGIEISVSGEVLTAGDAGIVRGVVEPLPPALFLRRTDRTGVSLAMRDFAAEIAGEALIARLHAINLELSERFAVQEEAYDTGLTAEAAFQSDHAAPRDFAHMFIALVREAGVPARYVSGYHTRGDEGHAPHAWAEAYVNDLGWIAFDPSRGVSADASYVRVATALDASGATPVAGMRIGAGAEKLDVDVQVEELGGDA